MPVKAYFQLVVKFVAFYFAKDLSSSSKLSLLTRLHSVIFRGENELWTIHNKVRGIGHRNAEFQAQVPDDESEISMTSESRIKKVKRKK